MNDNFLGTISIKILLTHKFHLSFSVNNRRSMRSVTWLLIQLLLHIIAILSFYIFVVVLNAIKMQYGEWYIWRMIHICGFLSLNYSFNWSHNLNSHMFSANEVVNLLVWKSKFIQDIKAEGSWLQFVWNSLALCDSLVSFFRVKSNIICALTSTIIPIRIIHSQIKAMHS